MTTEERAQRLADLHETGDLLVLPTVWDVWSARVAVDAGFEGLTIGSHPVADAIGSSDGEYMDFAVYLAVSKRIIDSVDVPVNVTAHPVNGHGAGDFAALAALGVRRVTFGPLWQMWLATSSADQLAAWRSV
mgnify:CR=1 FL=1